MVLLSKLDGRATHGIIKKKQKTPHKEIQKAEAIMKLYYEQFKENENGKD